MASSPKPPKPVDPTTVINAQAQANRINRITPFGSQTYGPDGLTTSLPAGTQAAFNNVSDMAGNKQHLLNNPTGDLQSALLARVTQRYQQPQGQKPQSQPMQQIGQTPVAPQWNDALSKIWSQH